ncbi:hypothetical protein [Rhodococcus sp. BS-15]|uniref:hypothetical protein n=1 Tax=Rhodococcus sp. BS-15 TaxID=1304954 RepID=UPI000FFCAE69|nr:hypothetical protein [Rhodococcus sp. BS-15]
MPDTTTINVLDLTPGDVVEEDHKNFPDEGFPESTFVYTVDSVDRINDTTVHVFLETDTGTSQALSYPTDSSVTIRRR